MDDLTELGWEELLRRAAPYLDESSLPVYLREQPRDSKGRFDFGIGKIKGIFGGGKSKDGPKSASPAAAVKADRVVGQDLIAAGKADEIAAGAFEAASSAPRPEGASELAGRMLYNGGGVGPHGDEALHSIAEQQGFEGRATGVSRDEMDDAVRGGSAEMFRGVRESRDGRTPDEIHEQFRSGEPYHGLGFSGNGTYMSGSRSLASGYGTVGRYALDREANVVDFRDLQREQSTFIESVGRDTVTGRVFADPGRYAAARGYDAIKWPRGEEGGKAAGVEDEFIILNRTAVLAEV